MSKVPGVNAKHAVITPTCRANKTDAGAFNEAVMRCFKEYQRILEKRGNDGAHYHLVLSVERKCAGFMKGHPESVKDFLKRDRRLREEHGMVRRRKD